MMIHPAHLFHHTIPHNGMQTAERVEDGTLVFSEENVVVEEDVLVDPLQLCDAWDASADEAAHFSDALFDVVRHASIVASDDPPSL